MLMARLSELLSDERVLTALSRDNLQMIVDAANSLNTITPAIAAAAARLGKLVPTLAESPPDKP